MGEILRAKLTFGGHAPVSLDELREGCITEMQFHLPVSALDPRTLSAVLLRDAEIQGSEDRSGWAADIGEHWTFGEFSGYLQGFIDLIFEHEDRWFVADYKSNILGGYDPDSLGRAMLDKNYLLQARLYALALHRHLQVQLRDYDYAKHFGGVAYLFVRGFPSDGVWFERPSLAALESLGNPFSIASK
jgi:exodeoxyribonuclease V beta subunit